MSRENFIKLLELGELWEERAITELIKYYNNKYVLNSRCKDFRYDFILSNGIKYEVKFDGMSLQTGNIFIEFKQSNKLSGISITNAKYYIIISPINNKEPYFIKIKVKILKKLIIDNKFHRVYDDGKKSGYLFKLDDIILSGIVING